MRLSRTVLRALEGETPSLGQLDPVWDTELFRSDGTIQWRGGLVAGRDRDQWPGGSPVWARSSRLDVPSSQVRFSRCQLRFLVS